MASLYSAARATGRKSGSYRASLENLKGLSDRSRLIDKDYEFQSQELNKAVGKLSDTLSLASTVAGKWESVSENIETIEGKYGKMETSGKDSIFDKMLRGAKMTLGVGEYNFGDTSIKARDFKTEASKIRYADMYSEAMSNVNTDKKLSLEEPKESKKDITTNVVKPSNVVDDKFIQENKNKMDFNPYNPDNQSKVEALKTKLDKVEIKTNTPKLSFKQTFSEERKKQGAGGLFDYEGKMYTTDWGK